MSRERWLPALILSLALAGCGERTGSLPQEQQGGAAEPVATPPTVDVRTAEIEQKVVEPVGPLSVEEIELTASMPLRLFAIVDIIDLDGPVVLVSGERLLSVRWVTGSTPFKKPAYPADGRVKLKLAESQWQALRAARYLAIRPTPEPPEETDEEPPDEAGQEPTNPEPGGTGRP